MRESDHHAHLPCNKFVVNEKRIAVKMKCLFLSHFLSSYESTNTSWRDFERTRSRVCVNSIDDRLHLNVITRVINMCSCASNKIVRTMSRCQENISTMNERSQLIECSTPTREPSLRFSVSVYGYCPSAMNCHKTTSQSIRLEQSNEKKSTKSAKIHMKSVQSAS